MGNAVKSGRMSLLDLLIGTSLGQRLVVLGTIVVYASLFVRRPDDARTSVENGGRTFVRLFTLILAALLLASAIGTLVPAGAVQSTLGESAGPSGVVIAGLLGGLLPGGPYAVYPIVAGVADQGASLAAVLAMLTGYGAIGIGRVSYGLVFFDADVVGLRLLLAVPITVFLSLVAYVVV
jgi:uncharacterized membrane protein YraQ (UPF0718 family)